MKKKPSGNSKYAQRKTLRMKVNRILKLDLHTPIPCLPQNIRQRFFPKSVS